MASSCVWVGLTGGSVEKEYFSGLGLCLGRAYRWLCRKVVIFRHRVVFGSGLHVAFSKTCNFRASGCVWVGLTRCGVEKL